MLDTLDMQYPVTQEKGVNFIIDVDKDGNEIFHTSNLHSALYTNIGWSPNPIVVHFEKAVLEKYYSKSNTYTVTDMFLSCHPNDGEVVWILPFDDDHDDRVCVLLSYLSLMLPYKELLHWREHNIPPKGDLSETYCKRFAQGIPAESNQLEHLFRLRYFQLNQWCNAALGWQLLKPLPTSRDYHLRQLRIPSSDNQSDFDAMVWSLAMVLIESLNVDEFKRFFPPDQQKKFPVEHTIAWLKDTLNHFCVKDADDHIDFLKMLQNLRTTVVHVETCDPKLYANCVEFFNLDQLGLRRGFKGILIQAYEVLEFFLRIVQRGELSDIIKVPSLYDLREGLGALSKALFPAETETGGIYRGEPHVCEIFSGRELVPGITEEQIWGLSHHLMIKVVPKVDLSPSQLRDTCEHAIVSQLKPDATSADLQWVKNEIARRFIKHARGSIWYVTGSLYWLKQISDEAATEISGNIVSRVTYSKKLVNHSLYLVNHDAVANHSWYPKYVLHLFSHLLGYATYVYEYVLQVNGEDSIPRIKDLVSLAKNTTDVIEKIASDDVKNHLQVVTTAVNALD